MAEMSSVVEMATAGAPAHRLNEEKRQRRGLKHTIPLSNLFADGAGQASFQKWSSFPAAKWERCGSTTGEFCRWNEWSSAGSKVAAGERDSRHFHPMTFWRCTATSS